MATVLSYVGQGSHVFLDRHLYLPEVDWIWDRERRAEAAVPEEVQFETKPEQAITDWILRETGTEVWFSEPLGILNASSTTLRPSRACGKPPDRKRCRPMTGSVPDARAGSPAGAGDGDCGADWAVCA